eukprot:g4804.t1
MSWRRNLWKSVREVRVLAGRSGEGSQGARDFVKFHYRDIKILNPQVPFLVRETAGSNATLVAQFDKGVEKQVSIEGLSAAEIEGELEKLAEMGVPMAKDASRQQMPNVVV